MTEHVTNGSSYILDPESPEEMSRLINLDRMTTRNMGGPLAGVADHSAIHTVVDLACGPGGWVLDVAFAHPHMDVAGVDISKIMIDYARARARSGNIPNASFGVMDITEPLDFADATFDLVNARFLFSVLYRESWQPFITECTRILRPGGILRLTEMIDHFPNGPAHSRISGLFQQSLWRSDHGFSPDGRASLVTTVLPHLLRKAGYQNVRHIPYALEYSADTETWIDGYRNAEIIGQLFQPLFVKLGLATPEEAQSLYQQMIIEMHGEDYCSMQLYMSMLGQKPDE